MEHETIDYPGVVVDHDTVDEQPVLEGVQVRARPHFGTMGVAPREADMVDTVPPAYFGGNIDDWRIGKGATMYGANGATPTVYGQMEREHCDSPDSDVFFP